MEGPRGPQCPGPVGSTTAGGDGAGRAGQARSCTLGRMPVSELPGPPQACFPRLAHPCCLGSAVVGTPSPRFRCGLRVHKLCSLSPSQWPEKGYECDTRPRLCLRVQKPLPVDSAQGHLPCTDPATAFGLRFGDFFWQSFLNSETKTKQKCLSLALRPHRANPRLGRRPGLSHAALQNRMVFEYSNHFRAAGLGGRHNHTTAWGHSGAF